MAELRAAKGLRLADLAEVTGYTTSRLSQIERGVSIPSLTALAMVAMALGVEMAALLDSSSGPLVHITRAGEGRELRLSTGPTFRVVGSHGLDGAYTAVVQGAPERLEYRHYGERFILLLSGSATFTFGDDQYHLNPGDAIHYASHKTHEVVTTSKVPGRFLVITCPALF
ncbi:MAG: helix-turn-helix domain-containing protein [Actinomycetia bacterium]|nr:helix-turn-helix domain-containing protein [Actinomycetes bacterium]